jgi:two-component system invasion response regulator UvrY
MGLNIFIADDHAIVRKGLIQILSQEFPSTLFTEVNDGTEASEKIRGKIWDIILLDIGLPGRNGLDILKQIKAEGCKAPVLIISIYPEEQYAIRALKAGAAGFLNKASATTELIAAVHKILKGQKYVSPSLAEKLVENTGDDGIKAPHELLSDREMQVLQLIASGKTNAEIAESIFLSINTISTYRSRLLEKLHLTNNVELTRYALDNGFA